MLKHIVSTSLLLAAFWLANSGLWSLLLLTLGVVSVAFVVALTRRMDVVDHESQPMHLVGKKLALYLLWLSGQIISSNIQVVKLVWRGNTAISPTAGWVPLSQTTDVGKLTFANSITFRKVRRDACMTRQARMPNRFQRCNRKRHWVHCHNRPLPRRRSCRPGKPIRR